MTDFDELRLQMHLASKEIKDEWEDLEEKMEDFAGKAKKFSDDAKLKETGTGIGEALGKSRHIACWSDVPRFAFYGSDLLLHHRIVRRIHEDAFQFIYNRPVTFRCFVGLLPIRICSECGPTGFGCLTTVVRQDIDKRVFGERGILRNEITDVRHSVPFKQQDRMIREPRM